MKAVNVVVACLIICLLQQRPVRGQSETESNAGKRHGLSVGAAVVDVTPNQLPVLVNGGVLPRTVGEVKTRVKARAIVLRDLSETIALVVVDSCMLPKQLTDDVKTRVAGEIGLRPDRIMISATHTHTAPSAFAALGTPADPSYLPFLRERLVDAIVQANANVQPARYGWATADAPQFTALRRWILRPDRIREDPFGNPTVRATMHSARDLDDVTGPSGPEDPELSMIAFQSLSGEPIAVLANFSMHYFGDADISADYFGLFCDGLESKLSGNTETSDETGQRVVGVLSHGCSGDIWRRDYATWNGKDPATIDGYTQGLLEIAMKAYESIEYQREGNLAMAEQRIPLRYRVPDLQLLEWGQRIVDEFADGKPKTQRDVYAMEQVLLHEMQSTEVVVQAIRIGDIAIATTPNETYALTGLKLKLQSPLHKTMVIELANGADGYIPPPEQHRLGGYNTWAARSAGLQVTAEPKIAATALTLLEQVADQPRRMFQQSLGPAADAVLEHDPVAYWRFDEMQGPTAWDHSGNHRDAVYEPDVVFFLEGPQQAGFTDADEINRCAHFAAGRVRARLDDLGDSYTVAFSFWNGMPVEARETTGWLFSRDHDRAVTAFGEHLGIGGTSDQPGRLIFQYGDRAPAVGTTKLERWSWNRVTLVRDRDRVRVYLNGDPEPEIDVEVGAATAAPWCFIGGRCDNDSNFEGRIDEAVVYDRVVAP